MTTYGLVLYFKNTHKHTSFECYPSNDTIIYWDNNTFNIHIKRIYVISDNIYTSSDDEDEYNEYSGLKRRQYEKEHLEPSDDSSNPEIVKGIDYMSFTSDNTEHIARIIARIGGYKTDHCHDVIGDGRFLISGTYCLYKVNKNNMQEYQSKTFEEINKELDKKEILLTEIDKNTVNYSTFLEELDMIKHTLSKH